MRNIRKYLEYIFAVLILILLFILVIKVDNEIIFMVLSFLAIPFAIKRYMNLFISVINITIINRGRITKQHWVWIILGSFSFLRIVMNLLNGRLYQEWAYRDLYFVLLGLLYLVVNFEPDKITEIGIVVQGKLHNWEKIISWSWKFQYTSTQILLVPKKSKRKPEAEVTLDVPTEKVEQVSLYSTALTITNFQKPLSK